MDKFSASLAADRREIVFAPTVYKFQRFAEMAQEFGLNDRDVVLCNESVHASYMKELGLKCQFVFRNKFGSGEPSEEMIQNMYDAIPYDSYDRVVAVGGGAILDLSKLLGCRRPDTVHNLFFKRFPVVHEKDVIAIPTTCGTGSECTNISVAIVKDEKDGRLTGRETKLGLVSDDIIPNRVCLIPELLRPLPYKPFACSAIDALIHATESFLSPHRKTMTSELFSEKAMDMILKGFKLISEQGEEARMDYLDEFITASFYAGIAFLKAGCGPVHGMSFPLGGTYHVPHGESNYMLFGAILKYYDEKNPDGEILKFKKLVARILGCADKDAISTLNALLQRILPLRPLRETGFTEQDIVEFPKSVEINQQRLMNNAYYSFERADMERIYRECY
ncbi:MULTISPECIES: 4-hydroxybutyrate dehydrogenase [unclassified Oscillibacter]|uniref:4-hydroxybutyrate dehydrogenase n=1 Tax=unclassified Oscillibacter TaxID=2629304 RepID=UPI0025E8305F|nr:MULTISPECIES: 4-hydroxybutyrate dehydrogenase [unclassified Oscillibacter]